ncbi:MAG: DUF1273 family protein [Oscillospiraceae bacterium]|nr:DUF1273 family protein [Oscillospiraceae bacterium]
MLDRSKTACFTGHRPEKLPDGGDDNSPVIKVIKSCLYAEIERAAAEGYNSFITGMQRGIDLWAGECVLDLMNSYDLHIAAAVPYRDFGQNFKGKDKWLFGRIIDNAEHIAYISEEYEAGCMSRRNRYMVDHSSLLIAVRGADRSGTSQTMGYARKCGITIRTVDISSFTDGQTTLF